MKKITLLLVAMISTLALVAVVNQSDKNKVAMTSTSLLYEDFSKLVAGDMSTTSSAGSAAVVDSIPTASTLTAGYQAGGTLKLSSSSTTGSITFNTVDASSYDSIRVEFDAKSWQNKATNFIVIYGNDTNIFSATQSGAMPFTLSSFDHAAVTFAAASTPTAVTITLAAAATNGDKRGYLDNVQIFGVTADVAPQGNVITLPYTQDFSQLSEGDLTTSSSTASLTDSLINSLNGIDTISKGYQAGGILKFSSSSAVGYLTTDSIYCGSANKIQVSFDAVAWNNKSVAVVLNYGTQTDTIALASYTGGYPIDTLDFGHYIAVFDAEATATPMTVTSAYGTNGSGDYRFYFDNFTIEEYDSTAVVVNAPTITPGTSTVIDSVVVTITADSTATIYYTLDGTTPTSASTLYNGPFVLTSTTTVKAIAMIGSTASPVTTTAYTFPDEVANIAAFIAAGQGSYKINGTVTAVYQNGNNLYIQDASASTLVYGATGQTYNNGDQITGMVGTYATYNGASQITPVSMPAGVAGTPVMPTVVTLGELTADDVHRFVRIENITMTETTLYTTTSRTNGNITDGTTTLVMRNNFYALDGTYGPENTYNFEGFVSIYNGAIQLYPLSFDIITGVEMAEEALNIYVNNGNIYVPAEAGEIITVFDVTGMKLFETVATDNMTVISEMPNNTLLVVKVGNHAAKVVK
ncbi:MAG: FN3 associated domain-containing protein [Bacteroidales bacterium]|nr:FN3 associated domain-containing protein [Bacteroidales bacterium]